jgi:16S rRNA G1207 methylase RsmC
MNPPFAKGQDYKHVGHAVKWLKPGGKLFAIVPAKDCPKMEGLGARTVREFAAGAFKESGTSVATRLITIEAPVAA